MPFPIQIIDNVIKYPRTAKAIPDYIVEMTNPIPFCDLPFKERNEIIEQISIDKDYIHFWSDYNEYACFQVNFNKGKKSHPLKINGWIFTISFALLESHQCTFAIEVRKASVFTTFYFTTSVYDEKPMLKLLLGYLETISRFKSIQSAKAFYKNKLGWNFLSHAGQNQDAVDLHAMYIALQDESKGKRDQKHIDCLRNIYKARCQSFVREVKFHINSVEEELQGNEIFADSSWFFYFIDEP